MNLFKTRIRFAIYVEWLALLLTFVGFATKSFWIFLPSFAIAWQIRKLLPAQLLDLRKMFMKSDWLFILAAMTLFISFASDRHLDNLVLWGRNEIWIADRIQYTITFALFSLAIFFHEYLYFRNVPHSDLSRRRLTRNLENKVELKESLISAS